ncbi:hypothetical protein Tco_0856374 [Tanacetum coccineum]|uniref:Uncharacterized protein n=1 Tax=Tanacetum coccineum TaxID=301880 RepID=A0ABQ5B599_9ASTR
MRIDPKKTPKEPTYQVVLDSLALSPLYPAFLITAEVLEIYMHPFWHTITKSKTSSSYKLPNQEFDTPPSDEEIVTFIKELGHKGDTKSVTEVVVDQMHQPWRTFATIINRCLSGKTSMYGALHPEGMTNQQMRNSPAYKTYLAFATGAATPKKARKFKKHASPSKKKSLVAVEETAEKPKKALAKTDRSNGIELPSKAALLKEAQLKKAITRSKQETNIHQAGGSILGDSDDDNNDDDQQSDDERTKSDDDDKAADLNKTNDEEEDEFVHTPDKYVPTDDENVDDEEYDRINKEMYDDVNVELKDAEPANEEKGDEEMTHAEQVNTEHEEVSQEVAGDQVKDDAQETVTAALAPQKTKVPLQSSSISSDYATKFLNFDNIPSGDTEIISMMDIKVQHENLSIKTSPLLTVPVTVILETSSAPATTIPLPILPFIPLQQQSTLIPTPTATEATTSTNVIPDSTTLLLFIKDFLTWKTKHTADLIKEHSVPANVVKKLKQQYKPQKSVEDNRKVKMKQETKQQEPKYTITSSDSAELQEFDQKRTLFKTMTKTKSFNKNTKHKALYHALIESILEDEDAMDKGVVDKSKKRKPNDADKDEGPPARPDQRLKRKKTGKELEPSKKAKSTGTSKGTTKSQLKSTGNSTQAEETMFKAGDTQVPQNQRDDMDNTDEPPIVNVNLKVWFKKTERPPTPDPEWNEGKTVDNKPTQKWLSDLAKVENSSKTFDDLMSTLIDFSAFVMNRLQISDLTQDILNNPEGDKYPFELSKPLPLIQSRNRQIVSVDYFFKNYLACLQGESTGRTYTTSLTKTKAAKYDLPGIEDMVPNLWSLIKVAYNKHALLGTSHWGPKRQRFYRYDSKRVSKHDVYSTKRILAMTNVKVNNRLFNLDGDVIVHLAAALRMVTRRIVIQKRVEDLQLGVESYQKKLNVFKPKTREEDLSRRTPYTTLSDPQGVIYEDKLNKKRLMRFDELHKFSDSTLQSVRDTLHDMAMNLRMGYNKAMPKRRWSHLDKTRSHIMVILS